MTAGITQGAVCDICNSCCGRPLHCLAAKTRALVVANDIQHSNDPRFARVRSVGAQTCLCIPLLVGERLFGVLSFASRSKTHFTPAEIEFLQLIAGYVAIAMDRACSEELLRDRARRVQIALEAARMGAWELDVLGSGRPPVTDLELMRSLDTGRVSPPMEQMMRLDPGGFHSHRELERHLHPDDRAATLEALRAAIEGDRPYDIEHRYLWPDGSIHWIHCRGMLFRDGEGAKQRLMGVSTDVTARKQAEL